MARKVERGRARPPADRSACIMPIYYNAGFKATLVAPLLVGCGVALPAQAAAHDIEQWAGRIATDVAHRLAGVPAGRGREAARIGRRSRRLPALRLVCGLVSLRAHTH